MGVTPQQIEKNFYLDENDAWRNYSVRQDILNVLYDEYGLTRPTQEPTEFPWREHFGLDDE